MANKELITCDYAGCDKPFAYRVTGFNLCSEHLNVGQENWQERFLRVVKLMKRKDEPKTSTDK